MCPGREFHTYENRTSFVKANAEFDLRIRETVIAVAVMDAVESHLFRAVRFCWDGLYDVETGPNSVDAIVVANCFWARVSRMTLPPGIAHESNGVG